MKKQLRIYFTSDTHGHVLPVNYAGGSRTDSGLLNIAEDISHEANTLVMDGGDSLQGTPFMQYYLEHKEDYSFHPAAEGFNAMGLDFYTFGNHDFNFGYEALRDYAKAMNGVLTAANVEDLKGEIPIQKWQIKTMENGMRVGITGAVTAHVNIWEKKEHLEFLKISAPIPCVQKALEEMRGKCDLTVCIYHGGFEEDLHTHRRLSDSTENEACKMARLCDLDILLTGHQHMAVPEAYIGNTLMVQPPANAEYYNYIEAELDENGEKTYSASLEKVGNHTNEKLLNTLQDLEDRTEKWLDQPIGTLAQPIEPEEKLQIGLHGSQLAAIFNQVQLEHADADISCVGLGNSALGLPKEISIRDIYATYSFANTSVVKEITGSALKEALERCATYLEVNEEGEACIGPAFLEPKIEHYNYDLYAGLDYAFDIRKPHGERVVRMNRLDGTRILPEDKLRLVTSDYRATGTGGYEMIGVCPTVFSGADNVQDLIIDYIRSHEIVEIPDNYRFEVIL